MGVGRIDAFERGRGQFGAQPAQFAEQRARGLAQIKPVDAAVGLVAAALDPAIVAQPVDQPGQRDRLHFHLFGEFRLLQALGALDLGQHRPLRPGDAVARGLLVGIGAHHPLHFAKRKQEVHIHRTAHSRRLHKLRYNKLAHEFVNERLPRRQHMARIRRHCHGIRRLRGLGLVNEMLHIAGMTATKPAFPAPDHDHDRCAADAIRHAERVCERRAQKFTPIRRQVLQALLSSHRPLGAYEVIDELAKVDAAAGADHGLSRARFPDGERPRSSHREPQRVSRLRA